MGRRSSASQLHFYRSVVVYFLPWALVAAITVAAVWAGVAALGQKELSTRPPVATKDESPDTKKLASAPKKSPEPKPTSSPTAQPTSSPTAQPTSSPTASPTPGESPRSKTPLITDDITVQVLNGTAASTADDQVATRLTGLGFEVVTVQPASTAYPLTTVFWSSPASKDAANALAQRFGWQVEPKPENLSTSVAIHVVVGADET